MGAKFPFSMENIPRQRSFACLSLKFGSILSALIIIVYSILALGQCLAILNVLPSQLTPEDTDNMASYGVVIVVTIVNAVTLFITTVMLIGVLREKPHLMKPWVVWTSLQVTASVLMFVFWSTMNIINHSAGDSSLLLYVVEFLGLMIRFYMLMLVASYYKQLEEEMDETGRLRSLVSEETWYSAV